MNFIEKLYKLKRMIVKRIIYIYKTYFTSDGKYKSLLSDRLYIIDQYKKRIGRKPDLKNPKTFSEKLNWLKLYDRRPEYKIFVDKFAVRDYISKTIGDEYLIPLLGVWNKPEDIDISILPERFVLKCNHDSGGVVICRDKNSFSLENAQSFLDTHLNKDYYKSSREWPYKKMKRLIIAESFLEESCGSMPKDYKFYCFDGKVKFLYCTERSDAHEIDYLTFISKDWEKMPFEWQGQISNEVIPEKPINYEEMIKLAEKISRNYPFLRVDFYNINGKIYFSELTLFPTAGMMIFSPEEWDRILGDWLELPNKKKRG